MDKRKQNTKKQVKKVGFPFNVEKAKERLGGYLKRKHSISERLGEKTPKGVMSQISSLEASIGILDSHSEQVEGLPKSEVRAKYDELGLTYAENLKEYYTHELNRPNLNDGQKEAFQKQLEIQERSIEKCSSRIEQRELKAQMLEDLSKANVNLSPVANQPVKEIKEEPTTEKDIDPSFELSEGEEPTPYMVYEDAKSYGDITVTGHRLEPNQMATADFIAVNAGKEVKPDSQEYLTEQDMLAMALSARESYSESIETKSAEPVINEQQVIATQETIVPEIEGVFEEDVKELALVQQEQVQEEMDVRSRFQVQSIDGVYYALDENLEGGKMKLIDYYKHLEEQSKLVEQTFEDGADLDDVPSLEDKNQMRLELRNEKPANDEPEINHSPDDELEVEVA